MAALEDPDPTVRDWAALGLGSLLEVDTPAVRDALATRLNDEEGDTAGEAALGLARRGDPRVFTYVLARLAEPDVGNLLVEAAGALGDPRLLPLLQRLKADGWQDDDPRPKVLDDALANCSRTHRSPGVVSAMGD
jgi:HEAT repeat protein